MEGSGGKKGKAREERFGRRRKRVAEKVGGVCVLALWGALSHGQILYYCWEGPPLPVVPPSPPSLTSTMDSSMSFNASPFPRRTPSVRLRERGPKHVPKVSPTPLRPRAGGKEKGREGGREVSTGRARGRGGGRKGGKKERKKQRERGGGCFRP